MARRSVLASCQSTAALTLLVSALAMMAGCGRSAESSEAKARLSRGNSLTALPHVTIVALSDWQGVIKPCGCVEELQRGGIERTAAWLKRLRKRDDSVVVVHAGALLAEDEHAKPGQAAQRGERMAAFAKMIDKLGVDAIAVSRDDLTRGGAVARRALQKGRFPVVATGWKSSISRATSRRIINTRSGVRVGVFALSAKAGAVSKLKLVAAQEVQALRGQGAQVIIALSDLSMRSSRRIVRAVEGVDVLLLGRVPPKTEPVEEGEIDGDAWVLMPPRHGAYMAKLTLAFNGSGPWVDASAWMPGAEAVANKRARRLAADLKRWSGPGQSVATKRSLPFFRRQLRELRRSARRAAAAVQKPLPTGRLGGYQSVGLSWNSKPDPTIAAMVERYDRRVAKINLKRAWTPKPAISGKASYVGEAVCGACHPSAAKWAAHDQHHHAWDTLVKARKTRDLDCVPCHVTGWQQPGGSAFENLKNFERVQCEACHGPGSLHIASPVKKGAGSQINRRPSAAVCTGCHSPEHAPRFHYRSYVPKLRAPGHGLPELKATK